jgi:5,10-methylenetetrahydromethanopterin reductase
MRLGVFILPRPHVGSTGPTVQPFIDAVKRAESYGFSRIVTSDSQLNNLECFSALTLMATVTERAQIGPQVTNPVTRDVGVMAGALGSLDLISHGRAVWIVGRGDGGVHNAGLKPASVAELREYFLAVRELFERGETRFRGRTVRYLWPSYWPDGPPRKIPLHMVAEGPRMLELAGAVADGVLVGTGLTAEVIQDSLARIDAGARSAGRDPSTIEVWWSTRCSVASSFEEALRQGKEGLSSAGNHALRQSLDQKLVPEHLVEKIRCYHRGYDYSQKGLSSHKNADLMEEMGLTDYFLDRFGLIGTPEQLVERLNGLASLGVSNVSLQANIRYPESLQMLGERVLPRLSSG